MKIKIFIIVLTITLLIPIVETRAKAISNVTSYQTISETHLIIKNNDDLNQYDHLIAPESLSFENQEVPLYVTFKSQQKALLNFNHTFSDELKKISEIYGLQELTKNNYINYQSAINAMIDNDLTNVDRYNQMLEFIDIFENRYKNDEIISQVKLAKSIRTCNKEYLKERINSLTPSYNTDTRKNKLERKSNLGMPNLTGAINYAKKYAEKPNSLYRYFTNGDCTNFISQILNNGGVAQVTSSSKYSGWWYKTGSNYSYSWTVADTFSRYMGRVKYNVSWNTFRSKLVKGSFIGKDNTGDGDVNHMAFITAVSNDKKQVQIAQHTTNYIKWSNSTGWTNIGSKGVYYLVR